MSNWFTRFWQLVKDKYAEGYKEGVEKDEQRKRKRDEQTGRPGQQ